MARSRRPHRNRCHRRVTNRPRSSPPLVCWRPASHRFRGTLLQLGAQQKHSVGHPSRPQCGRFLDRSVRLTPACSLLGSDWRRNTRHSREGGGMRSHLYQPNDLQGSSSSSGTSATASRVRGCLRPVATLVSLPPPHGSPRQQCCPEPAPSLPRPRSRRHRPHPHPATATPPAGAPAIDRPETAMLEAPGRQARPLGRHTPSRRESHGLGTPHADRRRRDRALGTPTGGASAWGSALSRRPLGVDERAAHGSSAPPVTPAQPVWRSPQHNLGQVL